METEEIELSKIDKLKKHVKENKKFYIGTATGFVVGAISATTLILLKYAATNAETEANILASVEVKTLAAFSKVTNNTYQTISQYGNIIGRPGKSVFNSTTGKVYKSITLASEDTGVNYNMLAKALNANDHAILNGHEFRTLKNDV